MSDDDVFVINWYTTNANAFNRDFGMMPGLVDDLNLDPALRELFLAKLDMIHQMTIQRQRKQQEEEIKRLSNG